MMQMPSARTLRAVALTLLVGAGVTDATAQATWRIEQDLSIGGDDERTIFVDIRSVVAGPTGNIFVLDFRSQDIRMFDANGRLVKVVARRGQGPGEISNANGMLLTPDGTLWTSDPSGSRWSAFSATDGTFLRQVRLPIRRYGYVWQTGLDERGRIVDEISVQSLTQRGPDGRPANETRLRLVDVRPEAVRAAADTALFGPPADTVAVPFCSPRVPPRTVSFVGYDATGSAAGFISVPFLPRPLMAYGLDGTLWCTGSDEFTILHRSVATGDTLHTIRGTYPAVPVTAQERRDAIAAADRFLARYP